LNPVIDAHSHLGDILYAGGGRLIAATGVRKRAGIDLVSFAERRGHRRAPVLGKLLYRVTGRLVTRGERARNATATLENFLRSMDEAGVGYSVALPIPPHVRYADLRPYAERNERIVAFAGVDYSDDDPLAALAADVRAGARGLKLHPIIQKRRLVDPLTLAAVEACGRHGLPVLFHCGISSYYLGRESGREEPRFGCIEDAAELVAAFPAVRFVAGHAGLMEVDDVLRLLGGRDNVWVDTSFQPAATVRKLVATFGAERVLFASDWPYGERQPAVDIVREACRGDAALQRRIFFENAAALLGIP
jgi:predicted TIM-barrel fold metal-dependent hydrolase